MPGPWTALKVPHLPLETVKLRPHGVSVGRSEPEMPFLRLLSPVPPHELFAEARRATRQGTAPLCRYAPAEAG
ncbi:hypothetical protein [Streptomyces sp. NBC_01264]|uniref:hypothetical protein n=1 Tax=Streptomyces sp. NBC_01264 TaxID=2903804 RepID=UPI002258EFF0|nr:hypothetical protein [Streptomyces sp. NBC_01264]MCX4775378.1 hypothetical protein [Streptomyces sp. NBC_01264]